MVKNIKVKINYLVFTMNYFLKMFLSNFIEKKTGSSPITKFLHFKMKIYFNEIYLIITKVNYFFLFSKTLLNTSNLIWPITNL